MRLRRFLCVNLIYINYFTHKIHILVYQHDRVPIAQLYVTSRLPETSCKVFTVTCNEMRKGSRYINES